MTNSPASEFEAFQKIHEALVGLDAEARARVLTSVSTLLGITAPGAMTTSKNDPAGGGHDHDLEPENEAGDNIAKVFDEFAELYAETDPSSQSEKALVAGYWLQVCQGAENFTGQAVNSELNHLGHKIANVTNAMTSLNETKPQLVLQLRKSGKSQQARKTYKLSAEGIKRVKGMIGDS